MGMIDSTAGWANYAGPKPWAGGISSFADNFLKAYALTRGLTMQEARDKLSEEQAAQAIAESKERMALAEQERTRQANYMKAAQGLMRTEDVQVPTLPKSEGNWRMAESGGIMPTETVKVRPDLTQQNLLGITLQHGKPEDVVKLLGQMNTAEIAEMRFKNEIEKQDLRNQGIWNAVSAKIDSARDLALINNEGKNSRAGAMGNKLAGIMLNNMIDNLEAEKGRLLTARGQANSKDRGALDARIAQIDGKLESHRSMLSELIAEEMPAGKKGKGNAPATPKPQPQPVPTNPESPQVGYHVSDKGIKHYFDGKEWKYQWTDGKWYYGKYDK